MDGKFEALPVWPLHITFIIMHLSPELTLDSPTPGNPCVNLSSIPPPSFNILSYPVRLWYAWVYRPTLRMARSSTRYDDHLPKIRFVACGPFIQS